MPWGDRSGHLRDPFGKLWGLMTRVEDLTEEEIGARWADPRLPGPAPGAREHGEKSHCHLAVLARLALAASVALWRGPSAG